MIVASGSAPVIALRCRTSQPTAFPSRRRSDRRIPISCGAPPSYLVEAPRGRRESVPQGTMEVQVQDETAAAYFRAREIEELERAARASDSTAKLAHYELAGRYALNRKAEGQRVLDDRPAKSVTTTAREM